MRHPSSDMFLGTSPGRHMLSRIESDIAEVESKGSIRTVSCLVECQPHSLKTRKPSDHILAPRIGSNIYKIIK